MIESMVMTQPDTRFFKNMLNPFFQNAGCAFFYVSFPANVSMDGERFKQMVMDEIVQNHPEYKVSNFDMEMLPTVGLHFDKAVMERRKFYDGRMTGENRKWLLDRQYIDWKLFGYTYVPKMRKGLSEPFAFRIHAAFSVSEPLFADDGSHILMFWMNREIIEKYQTEKEAVLMMDAVRAIVARHEGFCLIDGRQI